MLEFSFIFISFARLTKKIKNILTERHRRIIRFRDKSGKFILVITDSYDRGFTLYVNEDEDF